MPAVAHRQGFKRQKKGRDVIPAPS
jgi:hypothetical protein